MDKQIINYRIMMILESHLISSLSINDFKEMTDSLNMGKRNIELRDAIITEAKNKVFKIQSDAEWELLESFEEEI